MISLCFIEAFRARHENRISQLEYFQHLTDHLRGVRHKSDDLDNQDVGKQVRARCMFAASFRVFALSNRTLSREDTTLYVQLLLDCSAGDLKATKSSFTRLENEQSLPVPIEALAVMAARQGYADILDFCLQKGATLDGEVDLAAGQAVDNAEMIELLWNRNWRDIQNTEEVQLGMVRRAVNRPVGMLEFLVRHGAKVPSSLFNSSSVGTVSLPVMKILVEECGIDSLKGTAALTFAVRERRRDLVEYLCEKGVAVNDVPPELDEREPSMCSPLFAAVRNKDISMMELLLEHGADPHAPFVEYQQDSVLHAVQKLNDKELLNILEKYTAAGTSDSTNSTELESGQAPKCIRCGRTKTPAGICWISPAELAALYSDVDKLW